jgi:protein-S-isoprenylcysteine O-methyltransferase Ste14
MDKARYVLAYVSLANLAGTWVLALLVFPATDVLVLMEERELRERFGAGYEAYCQQVSRWIPARPRG